MGKFVHKYIDIDNITPSGIPAALIQDEILSIYKYSSAFSSTSDAAVADVLTTLQENHELVHSHLNFDGSDSFSSLYKDNDLSFTVYFHNKQWNGTIAGNDTSTMNKLYDEIMALLPPIVENDPNRVYVKFWSQARGQAAGWMRRIDVQPWPDLEQNYPASVREALTQTINLEPVVDGGKLILWHGKPGTGKTHAIRSLAQAWKSWCTIEYVIDPEKFFGDASYMVQTLMGSGEHEPGARREGEPLWRLVVIEDAGEFIREDASSKTGQGLSRLLNLTDGLIGQGLRLIVLMTTNEQFTDLAASVARSGRCLSHLEFKPFTKTEARNWLDAPPSSTDVGQTEWILADLYAQQTEQKQILAAAQTTSSGVYL